jgi:zinc-ribbon domain
MDLVIAIIIAGGLGIWTYTDAKRLDQRGIRVMNWSPAAWGWLVFLFALLFGILYLVQRSKALKLGLGPAPQPTTAEPEPDPEIPRRFCPKCGTQIVRYAAYCHACGREVERIPH